jgi:hypothetical protein
MLDGLRDSLRSLSIGAAPRPARGEEPSVRSRPASPRGAPPPPPRAAVAGVLQHRVSLGAGWRPRLFVLGRGGVLRYYKAYGPAAADVAALLDAVRAEEGEVALVGAEVSILEARDRARASARAGAAAAALLHRTVSSAGSDQAAARPPVAASPLAPAAAAPFEPRGEVHLGVARVRLSGADARRLYIHTGTDTLTVRAEAADDRWAWAEALAGAKRAADDAAAGAAVAPGAAELAAAAADAAARLAAAGVDAETRGAVGAALSAAVAAARERDALLSRVRALEQDRRALETALAVEGGRGGDPAPRRSFDSASGGAPRPGGAATPSPRGAPPLGSDDGEGGGSAAGLGGDTSEEEEEVFFDADTGSGRASRAASRSASAFDLAGADLAAAARALAPHAAAQQPQPQPPQPPLPEPAWLAAEGPPPPRRDRLPPPEEPERSISLWSLIREMVGKDLTRVCLPVYFNEPLSALQKSAEDLEYSASAGSCGCVDVSSLLISRLIYSCTACFRLILSSAPLPAPPQALLDEAAALPPASPERLLRVAAFAVSAYSSTEGRTAKPFNPLLGETYELAAPERGWRFLAEKVRVVCIDRCCDCDLLQFIIIYSSSISSASHAQLTTRKKFSTARTAARRSATTPQLSPPRPRGARGASRATRASARASGGARSSSAPRASSSSPSLTATPTPGPRSRPRSTTSSWARSTWTTAA